MVEARDRSFAGVEVILVVVGEGAVRGSLKADVVALGEKVVVERGERSAIVQKT